MFVRLASYVCKIIGGDIFWKTLMLIYISVDLFGTFSTLIYFESIVWFPGLLNVFNR